MSSAPLVLWFFDGSATRAATAAVLLVFMGLAVKLISRGQQLHRAFDASAIAQRPRLPRKALGSAMLGIVVFLLAGHQFDGVGIPTLLALTAIALCLVAFGPDPHVDKGTDHPVVVARARARVMLAETEARLNEAAARVSAIGDERIDRVTASVSSAALSLLRASADAPERLDEIAGPLRSFTNIVVREADRLVAADDDEHWRFARRRYLAKLRVLSESFESRVRGVAVGQGRDAFDLEADLLIDRMPHQRAA
ncbi:hypothetical protein [Cognatishimia sp. F0-27]|uniref:hypothetical protein n=1 Tax=Cognatishimia sp. F0-27 TaxID=2816855 RepID=UPI001D0C8F69|nr:hypothetical protein [Cognatishimia sp. F0-27]MCC1492011.1 hypothetical protein [Cognatishimia sp. F0-27]